MTTDDIIRIVEAFNPYASALFALLGVYAGIRYQRITAKINRHSEIDNLRYEKVDSFMSDLLEDISVIENTLILTFAKLEDGESIQLSPEKSKRFNFHSDNFDRKEIQTTAFIKLHFGEEISNFWKDEIFDAKNNVVGLIMDSLESDSEEKMNELAVLLDDFCNATERFCNQTMSLLAKRELLELK